MLTWLRELAATLGVFDRSALEPGYALRCTVGVALPLLLAALLGQPALGVPAAIGAFITGFTSLQGIYRTRVLAVLAAAVGMSLTSFVGALSAHSTAAVVAATAVAAYAFGTLGQLGPAASTVSLNSFVAFIIFSSQPLEPAAAAQQSALVLGGGLIQAALLLLAWPVARSAVERDALADVYRRLAQYAREAGDGTAELPPMTPLATARQILADPQPFARSAELARFNRLLEDAEAIRKRLGAVAALQAGGADQSVRSVAQAVATQLDALADVLTGARRDAPAPALPQTRLQTVDTADLAAHLADAAQAATMLAGGRLPRFALVSRARPGPYVQNHIDWLSPESLRFVVVLTVAMMLGRHFAAGRGYWIALTAALVLKPDFQTTFVRGVGRIAGTLVGAVVASLVTALVRGHLALQLAGIVVCAAAAYLTFNPNYAIFTVAITTFVVLVLEMRGLSGTTAIVSRLLDTLAGGALAMAGYLVLPSWETKRTRALLADQLDAQRKLAIAVLEAYDDPSPQALRRIDVARTAAWKVRTKVEASIDRTRSEPQRPHTIGAARALRILAAAQRFGLATLGLETALETHRSPRIAGLAQFARALDEEMANVARALRSSQRLRSSGRLPAALATVEAGVPDDAGAEERFVVTCLREYAESAARLARLAGVQA